MKTKRLGILGVLAGAVGLMASSCAYDPYYGGSSYSYGYGHGYGGSSFSTTYFISTGNPRWGYDPRVRCYYDYTRRCYYDPYLYGYYPVGYRPIYVVGAPHPYGWREGSPWISPPSRIREQNLNNYHDRDRSYRNLNTDWSRNVRVVNTEPSRLGGLQRSGTGSDRGSIWNSRDIREQPSILRRVDSGGRDSSGRSRDLRNSISPSNGVFSGSAAQNPEPRQRERTGSGISGGTQRSTEPSRERERSSRSFGGSAQIEPQRHFNPPSGSDRDGVRSRESFGEGTEERTERRSRGGIRGLGEE